MIEIHVVPFLIVLQALVLSAGAAVFLGLRLRQQRAAAQASTRGEAPAEQPAEQSQAPPSPADYLTREVERTRERLDAGEHDLQADPQTAACLRLREAYLTVEQARATQDPNGEADWSSLIEQLADLARTRAGDALRAQEREEGDAKGLLANQHQVIEDLRGTLGEAIGSSEHAEDLEAQIEKLIRVNNELGQCVQVLEDQLEYVHAHEEHGEGPATPPQGEDIAADTPTPASESPTQPAEGEAAAAVEGHDGAAAQASLDETAAAQPSEPAVESSDADDTPEDGETTAEPTETPPDDTSPDDTSPDDTSNDAPRDDADEEPHRSQAH